MSNLVNWFVTKFNGNSPNEIKTTTATTESEDSAVEAHFQRVSAEIAARRQAEYDKWWKSQMRRAKRLTGDKRSNPCYDETREQSIERARKAYDTFWRWRGYPDETMLDRHIDYGEFLDASSPIQIRAVFATRNKFDKKGAVFPDAATFFDAWFEDWPDGDLRTAQDYRVFDPVTEGDAIHHYFRHDSVEWADVQSLIDEKKREEADRVDDGDEAFHRSKRRRQSTPAQRATPS